MWCQQSWERDHGAEEAAERAAGWPRPARGVGQPAAGSAALERGPLLGRGSWPKAELPCLLPQGEGVRAEPGSAPRDSP